MKIWSLIAMLTDSVIFTASSPINLPEASATAGRLYTGISQPREKISRASTRSISYAVTIAKMRSWRDAETLEQNLPEQYKGYEVWSQEGWYDGGVRYAKPKRH